MLSVNIKHFPGSGQCPIFSEIKIYMEEKLLADGKLGGKYDDKSALKEFKKNPKRFTVNEENYKVYKGLNNV